MKKNKSRRSFLKKSALTTGVAAASSIGITGVARANNRVEQKLPREVWIAGISQMDLREANPEKMIEKIISFCNEVAIYQPDVICLPEVFATSNIDQKLDLPEKIKASGKAINQFSALAKQLNCYIICAVYTTEGTKAYNSAVLIDRKGNNLGEYHKTHLTEGEIKAGLTPGPVMPPVFQTDFGKVGMQICFDIEWDDGWSSLRDQGAEIVFWPSAFAGGMMVNTKAWRHKYIVASSTRKNTARLCDITGETLAQTGIWDKNMFCASVNLEKVFLHTWPYVKHFDKIRKKYGRKIKITNFHEEEWSVIESLSPDVFVADIMKEFNLKSLEEHIESAKNAQIKARRS